jgi:tetratricopeptide (TPR) repeat protein
LFALTASRLGRAYALEGRVGEAVSLLEQAVDEEHWASMNRSADRARALGWLGETYVMLGRLTDAVPLADGAVDRSRGSGERGNEAYALHVLGEIAAADPPEVQEAGARYRQALALADELGMRPLVAHCHLGLGTLYRRVGRDDEAQAELATAAELYRAMEMSFWLERAEAAKLDG